MKPQRILVVDDEKIVRALIRRFLEAQGHQVEIAEDGAQALERFHGAAFDILITDLNMPRMGGVELTKRIKTEAPETIIIVLTGYATLDSALEMLRQGCDDYLLKPINLPFVEHSIVRCCDHRRARLEALSFMKISQAKGDILGIICEEIGKRIAEWEECMARIEAAVQAGDGTKAAGFLKDLRAMHAHARTILGQSEAAHQHLHGKPSESQMPCQRSRQVPEDASLGSQSCEEDL